MIDSINNEIIDENEEAEIIKIIDMLSTKINKPQKDILLNQFFKLKKIPIKQRKYKKPVIYKRKENVPFLIRMILEYFYYGRCQISNFTFIQKNGEPYFEIHHINESRGHDWKNLLVVSPNIHAQFTFGNYHNVFDDNGWLRFVKFGDKEFKVKHKLDKLKEKEFEKHIHD